MVKGQIGPPTTEFYKPAAESGSLAKDKGIHIHHEIMTNNTGLSLSQICEH